MVAVEPALDQPGRGEIGSDDGGEELFSLNGTSCAVTMHLFYAMEARTGTNSNGTCERPMTWGATLSEMRQISRGMERSANTREVSKTRAARERRQ